MIEKKPRIQYVKSDLTVFWYLDDGCISGDPQTVLSNAAINGAL